MAHRYEAINRLILTARDGDQAAFGQVVRYYQDMAYGYSYAMLDDTQTAQDVAQEAFIEAYLNLTSLREPAAFTNWFRRILFKCCKDRVK